MEIIEFLQNEFQIKKVYAQNILNLIEEGNTIPFIARYRKEMTGSLDDQTLRLIADRIKYIKNLIEKKNQIISLIDEQELLTEEIKNNIDNAKTLTELEDIYRPFRPKRKTRSTVAKEKGLEPLANLIFKQDIKDEIENYAIKFLDENKEVFTTEDAINGAKDIIAEIIADNPKYRNIIRRIVLKKGFITSKAKKDESSNYEMYYDFIENISKIPAHRVLALNRGEKENFLTVKIEEPTEEILDYLNLNINLNNKFTSSTILEIIEDSYKRLIFPSIEREIRNQLTDNAEKDAINVFSKNLKQLLLQPPIKQKIVLAIDPGFRTGCKLAVIDDIGKVMETGVIYPTEPHNKIEQAKEKLSSLILKYKVDIIAIGNGTASRETEQVVADLIKKQHPNLNYIIVNEAGASVYSASKLASLEFPEFDVSLRSAVSIGRRLQDPLAELVKIEPKSIGVGQYQHDLNQKNLEETLKGVVEDCVNSVGVDLNTSSSSLLSYVSGINKTIAQNIINFREENGKFTNRNELLKVKKLGAKTFEQCAGFLRITDGQEPLDNTSIHPERYLVVKKILKKFALDIHKIKKDKNLKEILNNLEEISSEFEVGLPTLNDIIKSLEMPDRDPRDELPKPILKSDILTIEDLKINMVLKGTVRNITNFGAFIDIGLHNDALLHISEITEKFIKHPLDVISVGEVVDVKIISLDNEKEKVSLSMKNV